MSSRTVRTSALASREELADALQNLFLAELLNPSTPLWIITPWISDVAVVDNRTGSFSGLTADLPLRHLRLSEVLALQVARGGQVVVGCRPDPHNVAFVEHMTVALQAANSSRRFRHQYADELHEKGILSRYAMLSGSMNLTYNGLRRLEESILITNEPDAMARARHAYEDRWGRP
jgi:hypothetical protein